MAESPAPLKASVVVATYNSPAGLDDLIASLDAQTLEHSEWEAIFVDDGSTDDTVSRLMEFARSRPWMTVIEIPNSGWPCRPRNVGTDAARGDYVAYMDHDDTLYPDALKAAHDFAVAHDLDVVNGKEVRTSDIGWALDVFDGDHPDVSAGTRFPLSPTNPHKFYRRRLLNEHGVRFREGGRVLWEDIFFNVEVARHAARIGTLSSVPYYHWRNTPGSGSTTFLRSRVEWWNWFREVCESVSTRLPESAPSRHDLLRHQYRSRLLMAFNNLYSRRPSSERKLIFEQARAIQADFFPPTFDTEVSASLRMRASLLRRGFPHALDQLTKDDPNIPAETYVTNARWDSDGTLVLISRGVWVDSSGRRHSLRWLDDRVLKSLPPQYISLFSDADLDVTDEVTSATLTLGVRSVSSRVSWLVDTRSNVHISQGKNPVLEVHGESRLDIGVAAMGAPLQSGRWEITGRATLAGQTNHRMAKSKITSPAVRMDRTGKISACYRRKDGALVLDVGELRVPLSELVFADTDRSRPHAEPGIPLTGIVIHGTGEVSTTVEVQRAHRGLRGLLARLGKKSDVWEIRPVTVRVGQEPIMLVDLGEGDRIRLAHRTSEGPVVYEVRGQRLTRVRR